MDLISLNNAYLIVLLVGGVIVGIHAFNLYGKPLPNSDGKIRSWLTGQMKLQQLVGNREYTLGFICYLSLTEFLYLVLSTSTVILELSMTVVGNSATVGALQFDTSGINPITPILASSVVIAMTEIKLFMLIENAMRRVSHGVAGIPRYVNLMSQQINLAMSRSFAEKELNQAMRSDLDTYWEEPERSKHAHITGVIDAVNLLHHWIRVGNQNNLWSDKGQAVWETVEPDLVIECETFKQKLKYFTHQTYFANSKEQIVEINGLARIIRARLTQILAVLLVNIDNAQIQGIRKHGSESINNSLFALIDSSYKKKLDMFRMSELVTATLTSVFYCIMFVWLYYLTLYFASDLTPRIAAFNESTNELFIRGLEYNDYLWTTARKSLGIAIWDVLGIALIFFTSAMISLSVRFARMESEQWKVWSDDDKPIIQYMSTAFLATLITLPTYIVFLFVKLVVYPTQLVTDITLFSALLNDFGTDYLYYSSLCLLSIPCSFAVCRINDKVYYSQIPSTSNKIKPYHNYTNMLAHRLDNITSFNSVLNKIKERFFKADESQNKLNPSRQSNFYFRHDLSFFKFLIQQGLVCGLINVFFLFCIDQLQSPGDVLHAILLPTTIISLLLVAYWQQAVNIRQGLRRLANVPEWQHVSTDSTKQASRPADEANDGLESTRASNKVSAAKEQQLDEPSEAGV